MKETKENITFLKKIGFELDIHGYYSNKSGWGFVIDYMPNFKTLLKRLEKSRYNDGYDDALDKKKRRYGTPTDR